VIRSLRAAPLLLLGSLPLGADDWPTLGGRPDRNMVSAEKGLPLTWNVWEKKNLKWVVDLGTHNYSMPVISGGRVFIGTNNDNPRIPAVQGDKGILMCFSEADGRFLWQAVHDKLPTGEAEDQPRYGVCGSATVDHDRVYYVSNRAELVCRSAADGAPVWSLDMRKDLGISPNQACSSCPLVSGDLVFVLTGQGADHKTRKVKNPKAPSFIAVNRGTGKVAWQDSSPGDRILWGQWGSPAYGVVEGKPQVAFPGGDGWLYAFEPATGKLIWKFNCKGHEKISDGKPETLNQLVATPVYSGHRVLIAVGDPEASPDKGCLRAIDARQMGDVTKTAELWRVAGDDFWTSLSSVAVNDDLVYAVDINSKVNCLELSTGKRLWQEDLLSSVWGSPLAAEGRVYVQTGDGEVVVFQAGREKKKLAINNVVPKGAGGVFEHGTVVAANGVLYLTGEKKLFAIASTK
jgi:outer membrane protein assembly factor BamB